MTSGELFEEFRVSLPDENVHVFMKKEGKEGECDKCHVYHLNDFPALFLEVSLVQMVHLQNKWALKF